GTPEQYRTHRPRQRRSPGAGGSPENHRLCGGPGRIGEKEPLMQDRIVIDPAICHGKPVIRGTRTPVAIIVGSLAGGMTFEDIEREYEVTADDIRAALALAADLVEDEQHRPLPVG